MDPLSNWAMVRSNEYVAEVPESDPDRERTSVINGQAIACLHFSDAGDAADMPFRQNSGEQNALKRDAAAGGASFSFQKRLKKEEASLEVFNTRLKPLPDRSQEIIFLQELLNRGESLDRHALETFEEKLHPVPPQQIIDYHNVLMTKCKELVDGCREGSCVPIGSIISSTSEYHDLLLLFLSESPNQGFSGKLFEKIMLMPPDELPSDHPLRMKVLIRCARSLNWNEVQCRETLMERVCESLNGAIDDPAVPLQDIVDCLCMLFSESAFYGTKLGLAGNLYRARGTGSPEVFEATLKLLFEPEKNFPSWSFSSYYPSVLPVIIELSKVDLQAIVTHMNRALPCRPYTMLSSIRNLVDSLPWLIELASTAEGRTAVHTLLAFTGHTDCLKHFNAAPSRPELIKYLIGKYEIMDVQGLYHLMKLEMPRDELEDLQKWYLARARMNHFSNIQPLLYGSPSDPFLVRFFAEWWDFAFMNNAFNNGLLPDQDFFAKWVEALLVSRITPHKALVFASRAIAWQVFPQDHPFFPCVHAIRNSYLQNPANLVKGHIEE